MGFTITSINNFSEVLQQTGQNKSIVELNWSLMLHPHNIHSITEANIMGYKISYN